MVTQKRTSEKQCKYQFSSSFKKKFLRKSCHLEKIECPLLWSMCVPNYMKTSTCSFHWNEKGVWEFVKKKFMVENSHLLKVHNVVWAILLWTNSIFSENKENIFEIHTYQELCPLSLSLYKTSQPAIQYWNYTCHSLANCLYLHYSYTTKFDFMNYPFC